MRDTGIMNTATPPPAADGARLGTALTRRAAINAATQAYLNGDAVDMSALAAQLGIGRSTLYRLVGNRDDLLEIVLAEATERTFRRAAAGATAEGGVDSVLARWGGLGSRYSWLATKRVQHRDSGKLEVLDLAGDDGHAVYPRRCRDERVDNRERL
jgi:AcrR family transcriptional regulator